MPPIGSFVTPAHSPVSLQTSILEVTHVDCVLLSTGLTIIQLYNFVQPSLLPGPYDELTVVGDMVKAQLIWFEPEPIRRSSSKPVHETQRRTI